MTLSDNLQQLMRIHGNISISELARLTNIPQPTIHHILSGSTKNPRKNALDALSLYFSVSIEQLLGQESLPVIIPDTIKKDLQIHSVPVIEWKTLENWPMNKAAGSRDILLDHEIGKDSFAIIVNDSALEPMFSQKTLLIFDAGKQPIDRSYIAVHLGKENTVLCNSVFIENNQRYVKQNLPNGNVQLIKLNQEHDRILGTLIEARILY